MRLAWVTRGYGERSIKTVSYGLGNATLYEIYKVWEGPDDVELDFEGSCVYEIEKELELLGFEEVQCTT